MDHRQAAYWLSRDTAEAANFLARTAVANRTVNGLVKSAEGPTWMTPEVQNALTNAGLGAAVGGFGGLGVGLLSRRKKNPLTSALTGAVLGGVTGAAVPEIYRGLKGMAATPPPPTGDPNDALRLAEWNKMSPGWQFHYKYNPFAGQVPVGTGAATTGPPPVSQLEAGMAAKPGGQMAKEMVQQGAGSAASGAWNAVKDNPVTALSHGGILAGQVAGADYLKRKVVDPAREFKRISEGAHLLETPPGATIPGTTRTVFDPRTGQTFTTKLDSGVAAPVGPEVDLQNAMHDVQNLGIGQSPARRRIPYLGEYLNRARLGQGLMDIQQGRPMRGTPPPGFIGPLGNTPEDIYRRHGLDADVLNRASTAGEAQISKAHDLTLKNRGLFRKGLGTVGRGIGLAGYVGLPHALPYVPGLLGLGED